MLKVGILGLGLIGGSIAKSLRHFSKEVTIAGFDKNRQNANFALENKFINYLIKEITEENMDQDLVIIAVPISELKDIFAQLSKIKKPLIITDVCSVKEPVIEMAKQLLGNKLSNFVPGHPISGLELSGPENSEDNLFWDQPVLLTPLEETSKQAIEAVKKIWEDMGAKALIIDASLHDKFLAATSHMPHVLAYMAMHAVQTLEIEDLEYFIGGSFRDLTRVAESSPALWANISFNNKKNIIDICQVFIDNLSSFQTMLENEDTIALTSYLEIAQKAKIKKKLGTSLEQ